MCFPGRLIAPLFMMSVMAFAQQAGAQQPSSTAASNSSPGATPATDHEARFTPQPTCASTAPAALNPQLLTNIHVPLLAFIDVLQRKQEIADALAQWEAASQNAVPLSSEDEHVAYMIHKSKRTGHEISVAIHLQNPVRVDELNKRFDWKAIERTDNRILLTAEPRETVEQIFYRGFELQLDSNTHLPRSVRFIDRNGKQTDEPMQLTVKLRPAEPTDLTLTSAEASTEKARSREPLRLTAFPGNDAHESKAVPSDVPPDVETLLKDWEAASAQHRILHAEFVRRIYDSVFKVEKLSVGKLYFKAPNKGRMDIYAPKVEDKVSARKDETGRPYTLESDRPEKWIWTGKLVMQINEQEKFVEGLQIDGKPERGWLGSLFAKPQFVIPLVIDIRAEELKRECELNIFKNDGRGTWIEAKPCPGTRMAYGFSKATVILDASTHLVRFAKYVDPSSNLETVYSFSNWKVNQPPADDPLNPDLTGYTVRARPDDNKSVPVRAPKP